MRRLREKMLRCPRCDAEWRPHFAGSTSGRCPKCGNAVSSPSEAVGGHSPPHEAHGAPRPGHDRPDPGHRIHVRKADYTPVIFCGALAGVAIVGVLFYFLLSAGDKPKMRRVLQGKAEAKRGPDGAALGEPAEAPVSGQQASGQDGGAVSRAAGVPRAGSVGRGENSPDFDPSAAVELAVSAGARSRRWAVDPALKSELERELAPLRDLPQPEVEAAFQKIVSRGEAAVPPLIELVGHSDEWICRYASEALQRVTGRSGGFAPGTTPEERQRVVASLRDWWIRQGTLVAEQKGKAADTRSELAQKVEEAVRRVAQGNFDERQMAIADLRADGPSILPELVALVVHSDKSVGRTAVELLRRFTGKDLGDLSNPGPSELLERWREWWKTEGQQVKSLR